MAETISVNDVFESIIKEEPFQQPVRVLWLDRESDTATLITIENPPKQPWLMSISMLTSLLQDKHVRPTTIRVPTFMLTLEDELNDKAKRIRDTSWERIKPLLETKYAGEIFFPQAMGAMISAHAKETGLPRKTLYRLLYRLDYPRYRRQILAS